MEKYTMMSSGGMVNCMQEFDEIRATILAILVSYKHGCTLNELNKSYYELEGRPIPWRKFGHCSTQSLLSSMPDIAKIEENNNNIIIKGIPSAKTKHITRMVAHQRDKENPSRKTFRPSSYYPTTYPCMAFLPAAMLTKIIIFVEQHPEGVSMNHLVTEISSSMRYIRITVEDVETQLRWLSHRIYCTSYKIYPKNLQNKEARYAGYTLTQLFDKNVKVNAKILVSDHIKSQLENLISKHSDGIWCEDLPNAYLNEYRVHLYYVEIGFNSILEFVSILPDVFHVVQCDKTGNFKLFYSKREIPVRTIRQFKENQVKEMLWGHMDKEKKISTVMKHEMLTPKDVMVIGDYIKPIMVANIECDDLKIVEVTVTEVFTPTVFWIRLRRNQKAFHDFMMPFHNFYVEKHDEYRIPNHMIEKGLYCVCQYDGLWQRAIISKVNTNCVAQVVFLDYGTLKTYPPESLYYLHKQFSHLPSQAIPCSLFNVKPTEGSYWCETSRQAFALLVMQKDLVAIIVSSNEQKNSLSITLTDTTTHNDDIHITDELIERKLATIGRIESTKFENIPFEYYLKHKCEEEKRVKEIHPVVQNIVIIKNEEEAERKKNFESRREESVEDETDRNIEVEKEETKENDPNYNFAMDLHEWGNSSNTNSVNNSINLQDNSLKNSIYKLNENVVNNNFFEAVKNSSCYVSGDRFIPWSPSGNITEYFDYDTLNLENIEDQNINNTSIMTNTENRKENDMSSTNSSNEVSSPLIEIASENIKNNLSISSNDEIKMRNSESSYEINNIRNVSTEGTVNNSVETSKVDILTKADTFNARQKILLIKRLLNIRQVKSDSEDTSVSESKSSSDNCNSELQIILQELSNISEPVKVETEFDDTVYGQKKDSGSMDQTSVSDESSLCSSSLNDIDQSWASEQSAKYSSLNDTDSSSHVVKKTNSAPTENIKTNYLKKLLLVKRLRTNSSSKLEAPIDMLNENSLLTVTSSSNDWTSNSDLLKEEIDLNSLEEPLLKRSSTNSTSEIEELEEESNENSLVADNFKIPVFNDIDPSTCSDYDIPDPLSLFREMGINKSTYNEEENTESERVKITEVND